MYLCIVTNTDSYVVRLSCHSYVVVCSGCPDASEEPAAFVFMITGFFVRWRKYTLRRNVARRLAAGRLQSVNTHVWPAFRSHMEVH